MKDRLGAKPVAAPAPDRRRGRLPGHRRPRRDEGHRRAGRRPGRRSSTIVDIPTDMGDAGRRVPRRMLHRGRAPSTTTTLMEAYLDGEEPDVPSDDSSARHPQGARSTIGFIPVLVRLRVQEQGRAAAARRRRRLPAVAARRAGRQGHRPGTDEDDQRARPPTTQPFSALAFKIMTDPFVGKLTFFRVYSGTLETGATCSTRRKDKKERIGRMLQMHANDREDIKEAYAGDIVAAVGLKDTDHRRHARATPPSRSSSSRWSSPSRSSRSPSSPRPRPTRKSWASRCSRLAEEDPTLPRPHRRGDWARPIIARHGRAAPRNHRRPHAPRVQGRGQRRQAAGRPTARRITPDRSRSTYTHKKQTGGPGQFGRRAASRSSRRERRLAASSSRTRSSAARIPQEFIPAVEKGMRDAHERRRRSPATRWSTSRSTPARRQLPRRRLLGAGVRDRRARWLSRRPPRRPAGQLLEPIMKVEVVTPEDYMGDVIGDLNSRRGQIHGMEQRGNAQVINADGAARQDVRLRQRPALR